MADAPLCTYNMCKGVMLFMNESVLQHKIHMLEKALRCKNREIHICTAMEALAKDKKEKIRFHSLGQKARAHLHTLSQIYRYYKGNMTELPTSANVPVRSISEGAARILAGRREMEGVYHAFDDVRNSRIRGSMRSIQQDEEKSASLYRQLAADYMARLAISTAAVPAAADASYIVQAGDTMWGISRRFGTTLEQLVAANPQISDPNLIYVGQEIFLPGTSPAPSPPSSPESGEGRESLAYLYAGNSAAYEKMVEKTDGAVRTVYPDYFEIDDSGNLLISPAGKIDPDFIEEMHRQNIQVIPFISNHWDRAKGIAALNNREALSDQIAQAVEQYGLDGVNIDIENVNEQSREDYTAFVELVREKLGQDKTLSVAVAANPYNLTVGWQGSYDYPRLAEIVDYLMIMAYDESYIGSQPGPVASSDFFEGSIEYALDQGVPRDKIVMGIPFYGRYWKTGDATGGIGISAGDIQFLLDNYSSTVRFDEPTMSANATVIIREGDPLPRIWGGRVLEPGVYDIWFDSPETTQWKLETIDREDLRGVGGWALGQENPEIWDFYASALNGGVAPSVPAPSPEPEMPPTPELTEENLNRILTILNSGGNNRTVTADTPLTRGEAAVAIAEMIGLAPESGGEPFSDTRDYWGSGYIHALRRRGILEGIGENMFGTNRDLTKEELATIFDRILALPDTIDFHEQNYQDVPPSRWSYYPIEKMSFYDVLPGESDTYYGPRNPITVADLAGVFDRIDQQGYPIDFDRTWYNSGAPAIEPR